MRRPVPGKARVHELAKEFGVDSKTVLAKLKEQGEFVKSASSTVEAPVARRLREALGSETGAGNGTAPAAPPPRPPRPPPPPPPPLLRQPLRRPPRQLRPRSPRRPVRLPRLPARG